MFPPKCHDWGSFYSTQMGSNLVFSQCIFGEPSFTCVVSVVCALPRNWLWLLKFDSPPIKASLKEAQKTRQEMEKKEQEALGSSTKCSFFLETGRWAHQNTTGSVHTLENEWTHFDTSKVMEVDGSDDIFLLNLGGFLVKPLFFRGCKSSKQRLLKVSDLLPGSLFM